MAHTGTEQIELEKATQEKWERFYPILSLSGLLGDRSAGREAFSEINQAL